MLPYGVLILCKRKAINHSTLFILFSLGKKTNNHADMKVGIKLTHLQNRMSNFCRQREILSSRWSISTKVSALWAYDNLLNLAKD